jgi:hypothetical protein
LMCLRDKCLVALGLYVIFITAIHATRAGGVMYGTLAASIDLLSLAVSIFIGLATIKYFGLGTSQGRSTAFLVAALVMWMISDAVYYATVDATVLLFSDFLYFLAYPFLIAGIFSGFRTLGLDYRKEKVLIPLLAGVLLVCMLTASLLLKPWLSLEEIMVVQTFLIANAMLIVPAVVLARKAMAGFYSRPWIMISAALALNVTGQIIAFVLYPADMNGSVLDVLFFASYILFGVAFMESKYSAKAVSDRVAAGGHKKDAKFKRARRSK